MNYVTKLVVCQKGHSMRKVSRSILQIKLERRVGQCGELKAV